MERRIGALERLAGSALTSDLEIREQQQRITALLEAAPGTDAIPTPAQIMSTLRNDEPVICRGHVICRRGDVLFIRIYEDGDALAV